MFYCKILFRINRNEGNLWILVKLSPLRKDIFKAKQDTDRRFH